MLLDRQGLRWFWGLTCVFWAENAKRKIAATARSIESITFWPRWRWFITWPVGATGSKVRFAHYPPAIGEGQKPGEGNSRSTYGLSARSDQAPQDGRVSQPHLTPLNLTTLHIHHTPPHM